MLTSIQNTQSFGCSHCTEIRRILSEHNVPSEKIETYIAITTPHNPTVGHRDLSTGRTIFRSHEEAAAGIVRTLKNIAATVAENLKKNM